MFDVCKLSDEKHLCDEKDYKCFDVLVNEQDMVLKIISDNLTSVKGLSKSNGVNSICMYDHYHKKRVTSDEYIWNSQNSVNTDRLKIDNTDIELMKLCDLIH